MENKDLAEALIMAIINPKIMMSAMLKAITEKHGKLVDFQKVGCYSYEFKIEMRETEKEAEALFDQWADAEMGVKK